MKKTLSCLWIILTLIGLAACSPEAGTPAATVPPSAPPQEQTIAMPAEKPLPLEAQVVTIPSADGGQLEGRYYPGAANPSPLVVLMHWAPGDQHVWDSIAPWLQNRGITSPQGDNSWQQSAWFPPMAADRSYAVLTFTFSGCANGCKSMNDDDRKQWLEDAYAAAAFAPTLPGVDPGHIVFVGASIGADGAVDACGKLNALQPGACRGLSLSRRAAT